MDILLDADALIKLNRAGILRIVLEVGKCAIPGAVFQEAVIDAKAKGYEDAEAIEEAITGRCDVVDMVAKGVLALGRGEAGLLALAETNRGALVVSDDRRFQAVMHSRQISFLNCARLVALLAEERVLTADAAADALQSLKRHISAESFEFAIQVLASLSGDRHEED